jgi:CelD/BcsL family acetyltransferase involved in cellulose biosynthesis
MTRYESFRDVQDLREEWDALVERVGGDLFSTFDWCAIWWKHFRHGRRLQLYVARVDNELIAVLPLFAETIRWGPLFLRVVRIVGCDHGTTTCNVAVRPDFLKPAVEALMAELDRAETWDIVHLGELPGYSSYGPELADALRGCPQVGDVVFSDCDYPHMVFDLPESFDAYLASLSLKERRNVRRDERKLERGGRVEHRELTDPRELHRAITEFAALHAYLWAARGRLGHFGEWPGAEEFHREVAPVLLERGRLVLMEVRVDGKLEATEYGGRFGGRVHWIVASRRHDTTSRIGFCALVRFALKSGARQIDALPGYYDYKRRLGAQVLGVKTITVLSPRRRSRVRTRLFRAATWMVDLIYHRLWFWHVAPWLRKRFPRLRGGIVRAALWRRHIRARFLVAAKPKRTASARCAEGPV